MLITRTPLRISLLGGGTDLPKFYENHDFGQVLSFSISKYIYLSIHPLVEDEGINYNITDKIRITPSNGAILEPIFGSFGRVIKVAVIDPGFGFTDYPTIEMYTPL